MATRHFKRLLSSEDPDKSRCPDACLLPGKGWGGGAGGGVRLFFFQSCDLQAFDYASILEGALGVHGHVVQPSAVSLPLLLRIVCVPFPSVSDENLCLLVQEPRGLCRGSGGRRLRKPQIKSGNANAEAGDKSRLSRKPANTCFIINGAAATALVLSCDIN